MRSEELHLRLDEHRADFESLVGRPFEHFFCPILHVDDETELCKGHVVGKAFPGSARDWVVQRKDVDGFYGSHFEADFAAILYKAGGAPASVLLDKDLSRLFNVVITADGEPVDHFFTRGKMPEHFNGFEVHGDDGQEVFLGLKLERGHAYEKARAHWETWVSKDIRIPALVSLLKAAYLTLFSLLGYRYAISFDGLFLGPGMLGWFFQQSRGKSKQAILDDAREFFGLAAHMVRPAVKTPAALAGTITDRTMLLCRSSTGEPWAVVVFVKTSKQMHAVLLPLTESDRARELFVSFLLNDATKFSATFAVFEGDHWMADRRVVTVEWPKSASPLD